MTKFKEEGSKIEGMEKQSLGEFRSEEPRSFVDFGAGI
jgi:hypothetical protein